MPRSIIIVDNSHLTANNNFPPQFPLFSLLFSINNKLLSFTNPSILTDLKTMQNFLLLFYFTQPGFGGDFLFSLTNVRQRPILPRFSIIQFYFTRNRRFLKPPRPLPSSIPFFQQLKHLYLSPDRKSTNFLLPIDTPRLSNPDNSQDFIFYFNLSRTKTILH